MLSIENEIAAASAFSKQSIVFDNMYGNDTIIQYKRTRVRKHLNKYLLPASTILELNCGTGEDAIYLASFSHHIIATDISEGMLARLNEKIAGPSCRKNITTQQCSFTELDNLQLKEKPQHIFSNFGGLNCTEDLALSLRQMDALLAPAGRITLVIISDFCLWELLLVFTGKFKTATRRFFAKKGRIANVEGKPFSCWYYSADFVRKNLPGYTVLAEEGLCTIVPPSYIEGFAEKHRNIYRWLTKLENKFKTSWPWKRCGDYFIITLQKAENAA